MPLLWRAHILSIIVCLHSGGDNASPGDLGIETEDKEDKQV